MPKFLSGLMGSVSDLFFPKICQGCGERFETGLSNILCLSCLNSIAAYEDPVCSHCGMSLPPGAFEDAVLSRCRDCGDGNYHLDQVRAVGPYEGPLRIAHHGFKFEGMEALGGILADKMVFSSPPAFWEGVETLVPVPLSPERERERGYNPAALLAFEISRAKGIPWRLLLRKTKSTRPQMSLTREERLKNPKGVYCPEEGAKVPSKLVLVDDVFTTGATLEECAKSLKEAGGSWVGAVVLGRTPRYF